MTEERLASSGTSPTPENWLATVGRWVITPMRAVLRPRWNELVEKKPESLAVRIKVLKAITRFRVADYQRRKDVDSERAPGIAQWVIDQLRPEVLAHSQLDVTSPDFLSRIEDEIELHGVPLLEWVRLACLAFAGTFDPRHWLARTCTEPHTVSVGLIALSAEVFPFTRILALTGSHDGRLSPAAVRLLKEYCSRRVVPEATFLIAEDPPEGWELGVPMADARTLPRGWSPSQ